ncbi:MAG: arsenate reductase family protein [Sphaerochaeta sp.]|jgi:arsenate reductase|uniref:arsenate reductase family protein n=1 Tax=Sphaerochaeta sp. TaxID=1972642 RepID=UPI003D0AD92B
MTIICYPACSTCKKAISFLDARKREYTYRDIKKDRPDKEELREFLKRSNLPLRRFFNTSGQLYRSLNLKDRIQGMDEEEMLDLLASDGMLVRRPLLVADQFVLVGFKEKEWDEHLG